MTLGHGATDTITPKLAGGPEGSPVFTAITPEVYAQLRRLARSFMRGERKGHTLQPTAVLNEAFLRLSRAEIHPTDGAHLFRLVAQTMRRVLVDHARERKRMKRDATHVGSETDATTQTSEIDQSFAPLDVLDINAALDELGGIAPRAAVLLELRYFAGLDDVELGELCGVSRPTVEREVRLAKAFLIRYAKRRQNAESG
jgi:RNA polymerase sigma-70 factor (ECF subfamily)